LNTDNVNDSDIEVQMIEKYKQKIQNENNHLFDNNFIPFKPLFKEEVTDLASDDIGKEK
jgi:hypothetical protein